ncbi:aldehyde dehydrogenase family protein [Halocynthiibacter namhaensis]|uniref:aldehyde dehydrogenase family protein n=1 Tax=Halocynthiibacter namhaensis TaxID=1290553 RepID=UPI0009DFF7BD|nr:aldehyde dehydrogenase family protein [Halocynthiibacter namhaensis]
MISHPKYPAGLAVIADLFLDGKAAVGAGPVRSLIDPATALVFTKKRDADLGQIDQAVATARASLQGWADVMPGARARILTELALLIEAQVDQLAAVESLNVGKPLSQARRDVLRAAEYFRFYAGCCDKLNGETIPLGRDQTAMTLHEPIGVTAHILPWNYPISTLARGLAPALAVGAVAVVKPSELTPLSALITADLATQAGVPAGVFNVVCGGSDVGDHITFTGSTATGRKIMRAASVPIASMTLELGGKSPIVVLGDADIDLATEDIVRGIFFNAGQVCAAGSRLICETAIHDNLVARIIAKAEAMVSGHGLDDPDLGPLISEALLSRVDGFVTRAKSAGLTCVTGGYRLGSDGGYFYAPTIFTNVPADAEILQNEVFGPVLCTQICDDADHALSLANGTDFGLVAGIYTRDATKAMRFARRAKAGQVFVNGFLKGGDTVPFGGMGESGIGREKGLAGLAAYCATKSIILSLGQAMQTNQSLNTRAQHIMPGGVSHELRYRPGHPVYIERALGAEKWDVEGKRYIDFKLGAASQLLGNSRPEVMEAVARQLTKTPYTGDCHALEIEWAEWIGKLIPSAELVRFTGSGTESTMLALRLGRAYSGKDKVLRIDGHFHGWHDMLLKGSKPGADLPPSLGVPKAITDLTVVAPPALDAIENLLSQDSEIGTIFVEASGANYGSVPLPDGFLQGIRALATKLNKVLIFDEVITGFRWSPGGRQAIEDVMPDLTTLAKVVTGGLPGGAICGRREIMELLDPGKPKGGYAPPVSHKGTFNAAPIVAAGAIAAMELLSSGKEQAHADAMAQVLREGFNDCFTRHGVSALAYGDSSTCHLYFGGLSIAGLSAAEIRTVDPALVNGLREGLLQRGVDFMSFTSCVTSSMHTPDIITEALDKFDETITDLIQTGVLSA